MEWKVRGSLHGSSGDSVPDATVNRSELSSEIRDLRDANAFMRAH
jgi:hypothetical protein